MKKYLNPEFEICAVSEADVLRTSGEGTERTTLTTQESLSGVKSYSLKDSEVWH